MGLAGDNTVRSQSTSPFAAKLYRKGLMASLLCGTIFAGVQPALGQSTGLRFEDIGVFGGMSLDGSVIVGSYREDSGATSRAVVSRFGENGYVTEYITGPGIESSADAVSGDGRYVVGSAALASGGFFRAYRWNAAGGVLEDLGVLTPGSSTAQSYALGVSDDGARVVGHSFSTGTTRAFAWIEGSSHGVSGNEQMHRLSSVDDANGFTWARAISGDGRYAAGASAANATTSIAVRWDLAPLAAGGNDIALNLGSLTESALWSEANAISGDGSAVVGTSMDADGRYRAFLWREGATHGSAWNPQMRDLGTAGGGQSWGEGVSRNGNWVVGSSEYEDMPEVGVEKAFRWSEETGMELVEDWLADNGVTIAGHLFQAKFISDDGSLVGGTLMNVDNQLRAYIARVVSDDPGGEPDPDPGIMDVEEYRRTLVANAAVASTGEFLTWLPLNGAHHRPLLAQSELDGSHCAWATGDIAHHNSAETTLGLAEIGACTDALGNGVRLGAGVGTSHSWQDLANDGSARLGGQYVMGEIDWQPEGTPLLFSLTGVAGHWDVDVRRGYTNGADIDYSVGETELSGGALRARLDWLDAATFGSTSINPFASVALGRTHLDGYTETGGAFPARFDDQDNTMREVRLGVTAVTEITQALTLSTTLEAVHRSGDNPGSSGSVPGIFGFDLGGGDLSRNWVRAGAEIDYRVGDNALISASFNAATAGRDASFSGSVGLRGQF